MDKPVLDRFATPRKTPPGGGHLSELTDGAPKASARPTGGTSCVPTDVSAASAAKEAPSFRTRPWVRVVSVVMAVLLAVTMFDTTSLSPLIRDAQAAPAAAAAPLPMGERALFPSGAGEASSDRAGEDDEPADTASENPGTGSGDSSGSEEGEGGNAPSGASGGTASDEAAPGASSSDDVEGASAQTTSPWDAAWEALTADGLGSLVPAGLEAPESVLPALTDDFSDSDDIASRIEPALIAWGAPLKGNAGYQVKGRPLSVRYSLGNLGRTLSGGFIGGESERDAFVLTLELPYLYATDGGLGATYSEEEQLARTALADQKKADPAPTADVKTLVERVLANLPDGDKTAELPRVALFADDVPAQWSVWQEHDGAYLRLDRESLKAGASGRLVLRYEGAEGDLRLTSDALPPSFTVGFAGAVPDDASASVRFGYEFHSYTAPADQAPVGEEPAASRARVLRSAIGSIALVNSAPTSGATLDARVLGAPQMPQREGHGRGWQALLAAFTVPADSEPAASLMLTASWPQDWQGKGGVGVAELASYRVPDDDEKAAGSSVPNVNDKGQTAIDGETLSRSTFIGVPGEGGAVVLDVTGLTDEDIASLNPADVATLEALELSPLPYTVSPDGTITVLREGENGAVSAGQTRKLYVAVPYDEASLVQQDVSGSDDSDAAVAYEEVTADVRLQALSREEGAEVYHSNVLSLKSRFVPVSGEAAPAEPGDGAGRGEADDEDAAASPDIDGSRDENEDAASAAPDAAESDAESVEAPAARLFAEMPLYASPRSNVSPDTVINPHPLLLSENELVPGADSSKGELAYLVKSTDLTRMNLNMTFGWQQGHVGNMLNKTTFKVTIPYLYKEQKTGAIMSAYTYEEIRRRYLENPVNGPQSNYNNLRLVLVPDSNIFKEWDIVDDRGRRITAQNWNNAVFYPDGFTGTFTLSYRGTNGLGQMGLNFKRPEFQVKFIGDVPENTGASVQVGGSNLIYNDMSQDYNCRKEVEPGNMDDGATQARTITFIKTNLEWNTTVTNKWSPAMWDKYNYMVYRIETKNLSVDADTIIDDLGYTFRMTGDASGSGGMRCEDIMAWTEDGREVPKQFQENPGAIDPVTGKAFRLRGKPGEGGVLIYDVTALDATIWDDLDLDKFANIDEFTSLEDPTTHEPLMRPISYLTGGQDAQITFVVNRDQGGTLVPQTKENPTAPNNRVILLALPYTNNFTPFTMNGVKVYPNVSLDTNSVAYFGKKAHYTEDYSWSKTLSNSDSFAEAKNGLEHTKTAYDRLSNTYRDGRSDARDRLGYLSKYRIQDIKSTGNMPVSGNDLSLAYGAVINDDMPANYELVNVEFRMKRVKQTIDLPDGTTKDIPNRLEDYLFIKGKDAAGADYTANALQFEVRSAASATAPTSWINLGSAPQLVGPDPADAAYDIYRVGGTTSAAGIAELLEAQGIKAKPRNSTVTGSTGFVWTGKMRFPMAKELPKNSTLPLDIAIAGVMRAPASDGAGGRFTNTIQTDFGRKQWVVPIGDQGGYYSTAKYATNPSSANLLPESAVVPQVDACPYDRRDDGTITWGAKDGTVDAPMGQTRSGFTFHLSNGATSKVEPGVFSTSDVPSHDRKMNPETNRYEYRGYETKYIVLSKELLDRSNITSVVVKYDDPNPSGSASHPSSHYPASATATFKLSDLAPYVIANPEAYGINVPAGSAVIPQDALRSAKGAPYVRSVTVNFDTFDGAMAAPAPGAGCFVSLLGHTTYTGIFKLEGTFATSYGVGSQLSSTSHASLNVNPAKPLVYAAGLTGTAGAACTYGAWNQARPAALGSPDAGFAFHVGNTSPTPLQPGHFITSAMPLERYGATDTDPGTRRGFETSHLTISPELFEATKREATDPANGTVTEIIVTALDGDDNPQTYRFNNVASLLAADGSLTLTPDQWGHNYFSTVEVKFDFFKDNVAAGSPAGSGALVRIFGTTTWLASKLTVTGMLESLYGDPSMEVHSVGNDLTGAPVPGSPCEAVLAPQNGKPVVEAFAFDRGKATPFSANGGSQSAPLLVERSGYYFRLNNSSTSILQPATFATGDVPVNQVDVTDGAGNTVTENRGFQTESVILGAHLFDVAAVAEVRLYARNLTDPVVLKPADWERYRVKPGSPEAASLGADAVGCVILPKNLWNDEYFLHVEVDFDRFEKSVASTGSAAGDAYVILYGAPSEMNSVTLSGTLSTRHEGDQGAPNSKDVAHTNKATLTAATINPAIAVTAGWSKDGTAYNSGVQETFKPASAHQYPFQGAAPTPYRWGENDAHEKAWFRYTLTNSAESSASNVYYDLSVGEQAADNDAQSPYRDVKGFAGNELVIAGFSQSPADDPQTPGAWHHTSGDFAGIDVVEADGVTNHVFAMADLVPYINADGELHLPLHGTDPAGNAIASAKTVRLRYALLNGNVTGDAALVAFVYGTMQTHGAAINDYGPWTSYDAHDRPTHHPADTMYQYRYTTGTGAFGPLDNRYNKPDGTTDIARSYTVRNYIGWFDWSTSGSAFKPASERPVTAGDVTAESVQVAHYADGVGYNFAARNATDSRSDVNRITYSLSQVSNKLAASAPAPAVYGFKTRTFTLGADLLTLGLQRHGASTGQSALREIKFYFQSPLTGTMEEPIVLSLADLQKNLRTYQAKDGDPFIFDVTGGIFASASAKYLRQVVVEYDTIDPAHENKVLTAQFRGKSDWWNNYNNTVLMQASMTAAQTGSIPATTGNPNPGRYGQDVSTRTATLSTPRPYLDIRVHEKYADVPTGSYPNTNCVDGSAETMAVPYDRDFKVWAQLWNTDANSYIDGADVSLVLGLSRESGIVQGPSGTSLAPATAWTGFHTTKMTVAAQYLAQWEKPGRIRLYGASDSDTATALKATLWPVFLNDELVGWKKSDAAIPPLSAALPPLVQDTDENGDPKVDENGDAVMIQPPATHPTASGPDFFPVAADGSFSLTEANLISLGLDHLKQVVLLDWQDMKYSGVASGAQTVVFEGYSDKALGTHYTVLDGSTTVYLNNIREHALPDDDYYYRTSRHDAAELLMSKMYFDANTRVGYNNAGNTTGNRLETWVYPTDNNHSYYNSYWGWGGSERDTHLEIGYKALGTYTLDFRQKRNSGNADGQNAYGVETDCHYEQVWDYWYNDPVDDLYTTRYHAIEGRTYNSAAELEFIQNLDHAAFDAYYVRVRAEALPYVRSITVNYGDGSSYTVDRAALDAQVAAGLNSVATNPRDGKKYLRLNLLAKDAAGKHVADFSADEKNYYKDPFAGYENGAQPPLADRVTSVVYRVAINQPQYTSAAKTAAAQPDFGTWFLYNNPNNDAFEVTGRFYQVKSEVYSTTEVRVRLGGETGNGAERAGHKAVVRYDDGLRNSGNAFRSVLSYQDYVPNGHHNHTPNKMRHLRTSARANVVETGAYTRKGHLGGWENGRDGISGFDGRTEIKFASDQYYSVSLQRRYGSWDWNNWNGKVSFSDEIVLRDDMPVCQPDADLEYYGFLSTGMRLLNKGSDDVLNHVSYLKFRLRKYAADGTTSERYAVIKKADLGVVPGKDAYVYFKRPNEDVAIQIQNAQNAGLPMATLNLDANEFVVSYDVVMRNFGGEGDITQEVGRHYPANYNRGFGDIDVQVYGRPYTFLNQKASTLDDSTNYSRVFTRRYPCAVGSGTGQGFGNPDSLTPDPGGSWWGTLNPRDSYNNQYVDTDSAYLMGYLIPFGYHFSLQRRGDDSSTGSMPYFAASDNLTPASDSFEARFQNYADGTWNNQENRLRASHINHATLTATTNANFRMQKVYIPSELLPDTPEWPKKAQADAEGNPVLNSSTHKPVLTADDNTDWLRVKSFTFTYGATQIKLVYDAGKKAWLIQNGLHPGDYLTWQQLKDRGIVSTDKLADGTYAGCYSIDIEGYLREQFKLYAATGGAEGIRPITYTAVSATNLMPGFAADIATVNRTYVNTRITSLAIEYDSPNANRRRQDTMLDSNQFLAGDPTATRGNAYNYAFAYDGVYADRTLDDFVSATATTATDLAAGNWNEYATPAGNKTGMAYSPYTWNENLAVSAVQSKDPNRAPLNSSAYVSGLRHDPTAGNTLRHRLAQMETSMVRGKAVTVNGNAATVFGYDNSDTDIGAPVSYSTDSTAKDWGIPDGALYPGDYVEYTLRVGNKPATAGADNDVALEHVDAMFRVQKGQRIVGWEVSKVKAADGTWTADNTTDHPVAAVIGNLDRSALREAPQQTDLSQVSDGAGGTVEAYDENRVLLFRVGENKWDEHGELTPKEGRTFDPGEYVTIRVITQMTGELEDDSYFLKENTPANGTGDTLPHRSSAVLADWFAVSAPMHGYLQYTVPGGGDADHNVWAYSNDIGGRWLSGYTTAHERTVYNIRPADPADQFMIARNQFGSRVYNYTHFYNHTGDGTRGGRQPLQRPAAVVQLHGPRPLHHADGPAAFRRRHGAAHRAQPEQPHLPHGRYDRDRAPHRRRGAPGLRTDRHAEAGQGHPRQLRHPPHSRRSRHGQAREFALPGRYARLHRSFGQSRRHLVRRGGLRGHRRRHRGRRRRLGRRQGRGGQAALHHHLRHRRRRLLHGGRREGERGHQRRHGRHGHRQGDRCHGLGAPGLGLRRLVRAHDGRRRHRDRPQAGRHPRGAERPERRGPFEHDGGRR